MESANINIAHKLRRRTQVLPDVAKVKFKNHSGIMDFFWDVSLERIWMVVTCLHIRYVVQKKLRQEIQKLFSCLIERQEIHKICEYLLFLTYFTSFISYLFYFCSTKHSSFFLHFSHFQLSILFSFTHFSPLLNKQKL